VAFLAIWQFLNPENPPRPDMAYSEFIALTKAPATQKHIEEVEIKEREYTFRSRTRTRRVHPKAVVRSAPAEDNAQGCCRATLKITYQKDEGSPF